MQSFDSVPKKLGCPIDSSRKRRVQSSSSSIGALDDALSVVSTSATNKESTEVILNQYKAGITSYLNVATAQTTELNNALAALAVKKLRLTADVTLIKALGGTWSMPSGTPVTAADFAAAEPAMPASVSIAAPEKPALQGAEPVKLLPPKAAAPDASAR